MRVLVGELRKIRSTYMFWGILAVALGLSLLPLWLGSGGQPPGYYDEVANQRALLGAAGWAGTAAMLLGAIGMTGEERHKTLTPSLLAMPNRTYLLVAKAAAYAITGVVIALVTLAVCIPVGLARLGALSDEVVLGGSDWAQIVGGGLLYAALASAFGVGLGCLIRNQIAVVAGILIWFAVLENLLALQLDSVPKFTPGALGAAMAGPGAIATNIDLRKPLALAAATIAYVGYVVVAVGLGAVSLGRRDVA